MTNRKSRPIRILFQKRCVFQSPPQKLEWRWTHTISGILQQKCRPLSLVSVDIRFVRIFAEFSAEGAPNDSGVIENVDFHGFSTLRLRHLRKWGQHYYIVLFSPLSPFQWPKNIWPWMILTGYLALNSVFAPVWLAVTARLRKIIAWKLIKIDTHYQRCKSSAGTQVSHRNAVT